MRVYKFLAKKWAIMALRQRRLKIAPLLDLNDPFDLLPYAAPPGRAERVAVRLTLAELAARKGLICFSGSWSNPVIWAHYADQYKGICLGFDVPDGALKHVIYEERRLPFPDVVAMPDKEKLAVVERMLFTKYADWRYEDEVRAWVQLDPETAETGLYFMDFGPNLRLSEVVIGARSPTCRREIEAALAGSELQPEIKRAQAAVDEFSVVACPGAVGNHDDATYYLKRGDVRHPVQFVR